MPHWLHEVASAPGHHETRDPNSLPFLCKEWEAFFLSFEKKTDESIAGKNPVSAGFFTIVSYGEMGGSEDDAVMEPSAKPA